MGTHQHASPKRSTSANYALSTLIAVVGAIIYFVLKPPFVSPPTGTFEIPDGQTRLPLTTEDTERVGPLLFRYAEGKPLDAEGVPKSLTALSPTTAYVAFRVDGNLIGNRWSVGPTPLDAVKSAIDGVRKKSDLSRVTTVEVNLSREFRTVDPRRDRYQLSNAYRGLRGLEIVYNNDVKRWFPSEMVATNRSFVRTLEVFQRREGLSSTSMNRSDILIRTFDSDTFLVQKHPGDVFETTNLFRGNEVIPIDDVTKSSTVALSEILAEWLFANLSDEGEMMYKYFPSVGQVPTSNNMIRQWMATVAMGRVARTRNDDALNERVKENIRYNLSHYFTKEGEFGLINEGVKVKLGALALAALAIVEHPARAEFADEETSIRRTIDSLWHDDGSFTTFYKSDRPRPKDDNANFYPGEALLLLSTLYERDGRDAALLDRFMRSFEYYKEWHLENRNPAFVPWHTQAYAMVWRITKDDRLRDFIFEMNDWLVDVMQEWDENTPFPDTLGRFYTTKYNFGPPHASSTGVYLEGLIDAYLVAVANRDDVRAERYRRAMIRGIRSTMQLTFIDDVDMYYISKRERVKGGVRTTEYDNVIRVDNIQHNLMGILRILDTFDEKDFRP